MIGGSGAPSTGRFTAEVFYSLQPVPLGNVWPTPVSYGAMDRWWGPGWDGSLILSNNARPMPSLTIERNYSDASRWPVLRLFGPWRASIAFGQAAAGMVRMSLTVPDAALADGCARLAALARRCAPTVQP